MGKISSVLLALVCVGTFASNTMAADSIYKIHDHGTSLSYSSFTVSAPYNSTLNGFSLIGYAFLTENIALTGGGYSLAGNSVPGETTSIILQGEWHGKLADRFGYFAGAGGNYTLVVINNIANSSQLGLCYKAGLEYAVSNNIIMNLTYQNLSNNLITMNGINIGIIYMP